MARDRSRPRCPCPAERIATTALIRLGNSPKQDRLMSHVLGRYNNVSATMTPHRIRSDLNRILDMNSGTLERTGWSRFVRAPSRSFERISTMSLLPTYLSLTISYTLLQKSLPSLHTTLELKIPFSRLLNSPPHKSTHSATRTVPKSSKGGKRMIIFDEQKSGPEAYNTYDALVST